LAKIIKKIQKRLQNHAFPTEWFDGRSRRLTNKDFGGRPANVKWRETSLRRRAARMGLKLIVLKQPDGSIDVAAYKPKADGSKPQLAPTEVESEPKSERRGKAGGKEKVKTAKGAKA
jgi:hypothetical protein